KAEKELSEKNVTLLILTDDDALPTWGHGTHVWQLVRQNSRRDHLQAGMSNGDDDDIATLEAKFKTRFDSLMRGIFGEDSRRWRTFLERHFSQIQFQVFSNSYQHDEVFLRDAGQIIRDGYSHSVLRELQNIAPGRRV